MRNIILLGALCAISASAQSIFSVGVIGGAPFTNVVNASTTGTFAFVSKSTNYTVGPAVQVNLPLNFRVEFDALYRPYKFMATEVIIAPLAASVAPANVSGNQWRFPILAQYRFKFPVVSPFIEAGLSVDHLSNVSMVGTVFTSGPGTLVRQTNAGIVLGAGVDLKIPFVRLSGELRYTRDGSANFQNVSNLNQAEVLVGIHF
ncbi:MAG TPA: outer membrane beta-barrel protein [Bryobacteraceae bacterium]|jgi:hypothetical protein